MRKDNLIKHIITIRSEAKRRVRAFANSKGSKDFIREIELCLELNVARPVKGLDAEHMELLEMYEAMYEHMQQVAKWIK